MEWMNRIWGRVRDIDPGLPPLKGSPPGAELEDPRDMLLKQPLSPTQGLPGNTPLRPIAGLLVEIVYTDSKGACAARRITCQKVRSERGRLFLDAVCHERKGFRSFRVDRIGQIIDMETGEIIEAAAFVGTFRLDDARADVEGWGLHREERYHLIAGLKLLTFMARCDGEWHPFEGDVISEFILDFWDARDQPGNPPSQEIMAYARKLSPLPQDFYTSLRRIARNGSLTRLVLPAVGAVIDADGLIHSEEHRWFVELREYLSSLVNR